jgi:hypothetical protein
MKVWLIRSICITPILIALALIIKWYLVQPYSGRIITFDIEFDNVMKKGDREI